MRTDLQALTMAPRRASTRVGASTPSSRGRARGGIRKNTRARQPATRHGQIQERATGTPVHSSTETIEPPSTSDREPSSPQYSLPPPSNSHRAGLLQSPASHTISQARTSADASELNSSLPAPQSPETSINLKTMRQLLCSHEQNIVDCVLLQLRGPNPTIANNPPTSPQQFRQEPQSPHTQQSRRTLGRSVELENQLAALRGEMESGEGRNREPRALGTYFPAEFLMGQTGVSTSGTVNSIETLFPGVELCTLTQIVENRFKPTNIYRLLASEKERAEAQRTISIGGVEFEQAE